MALNFGILQPANIAGNILAGQQETQRNQLAQQQMAANEQHLLASKQQIETGALTQENLRMQIDQAKRDRDALTKMQEAFVANGKSGDLNANFDEMIKSGISHFVDIGIKGKQALERQNQVTKILGGGAPAPAPAPTSAPGALGSGTFDVNALVPPSRYKPVVPRNAMAPAPVVNEVDDTYRKIDQLYAIGEDKLAKSLEERVKNKLPPTAVQEYEYAKKNGYTGSFQDFKVLQAPKTTNTVNVPVSVSTEKKFGEQFASKMADTDIGKMTTAEKAPQLAASANQIIDLVNRGNVFTGPVADVKLNIARALNVVGANNQEKIANTEALIAATGQSTLDAIKSAGLGTGQGFTDKDLKFLQGIAGGTITYTPQTLKDLARLQHLAATRSAESWNTRVKQIPKSAIEGTGLSTEPIKVPPLSPAVKYATNPTTGARIQSTDGGVTWKPVGGR
jgi:hypothetical protein